MRQLQELSLIAGGESLSRTDLVTSSDSGVSVEDLGHHAGYYAIDHSHAAKMFYFFFESRNSKKDPFVLWLTGGPGCSSELAMFNENGTFKIADNMSLLWNDIIQVCMTIIKYVPQILEAITAKECQESFHYESLETLGDSFLKYVTCQHLYQS